MLRANPIVEQYIKHLTEVGPEIMDAPGLHHVVFHHDDWCGTFERPDLPGCRRCKCTYGIATVQPYTPVKRSATQETKATPLARGAVCHVAVRIVPGRIGPTTGHWNRPIKPSVTCHDVIGTEWSNEPVPIGVAPTGNTSASRSEKAPGLRRGFLWVGMAIQATRSSISTSAD
jgi:hypothetical protein